MLKTSLPANSDSTMVDIIQRSHTVLVWTRSMVDLSVQFKGKQSWFHWSQVHYPLVQKQKMWMWTFKTSLYPILLGKTLKPRKTTLNVRKLKFCGRKKQKSRFCHTRQHVTQKSTIIFNCSSGFLIHYLVSFCWLLVLDIFCSDFSACQNHIHHAIHMG